MTLRSTIAPLALASVLALSACGGSDDASSDGSDAADNETTTTVAATTPVDVTDPEPGDETTSDTMAEPSETSEEDCTNIVSSEQYEDAVGVVPEVSGGGSQCSLAFADDSVGTLAIYEGAIADQAREELLPLFMDDPDAMAEGVMFEDDRGFIDGSRVYVETDSGRVIVLNLPDNIAGLDDFRAAQQQLADIFMTK